MKLSIVALFFSGICSLLAGAAERPNIVFVFKDDHAPHAIGAYGGWLKGINPTPEIDRLAADGMYGESLKMPFIAHWPKVTKPGSKSEAMIQNLDYASTFLEMAGAEVPSDLLGHSLVPLLKGKTPADWRKEIYYHYFEDVRKQLVKLQKFYEDDSDLSEKSEEWQKMVRPGKWGTDVDKPWSLRLG